ncbi:MAG TPA: uroporphyrinogen decarboxylase family protein [Planctomycetota bacterium]|nr:uroporphyrinogen decarboxylase family protein [Planctomycetota bacterium]HRR79191.1 uroporphyrinogen decarboxylase family protein [Planctomycetota bacterium]HRT97043.1 uroporphyrinogen decarboxylase family protein [Planctomycetota bacterium]
MLSIPRSPAPDFGRFLKVVTRNGEPDRVPFVELGVDAEVMAAVLGEPAAPAEAQVRFWHALGYDYASLKANIPWTRRRDTAPDTADLPHAQRDWVNAHSALIASRADFERFRWPRPHEVDYRDIETAIRVAPEGLGIVGRVSGVLENAMFTLGFEGLSYLLADDPALVRDTADAVGALILNVVETLASMDGVGAIFFGEDMGFKTASMLSPAAMREFIFPWHRRIVAAAHARGKPILLHSCGNLRTLMDDILATGWDAKHSFEDVIQPITKAKALYGHRIAVLGGIDMDLLSRGSEAAVRRRVREVIRACAPGGGFALGSGNTVANYVPLGNYLAMLDEGWRRGRYPIGA